MAGWWAAAKAGSDGFLAFILAGVSLALAPLAAYGNRGMVVLLIIVALASLWSMVRSGEFRWPLVKGITLVIFAFLAWTGLSALWAATPGLALPRTLQVGGLILAGAVALAAPPRLDTGGRRVVAGAVTAGMLVFFVLVGSDLVSRGGVEHPFRVALGAQIPLVYSLLRFKVGVSIYAILLPALMIWHWRRRNWWAVALLPAGLIGCAHVAESNTGMLAGALAGGVLLLAQVTRRGVAVAVAAVLVAGSLAMPLVMLRMPPVLDVAKATDLLPNSIFHRLAIWRFAAEHVRERPLAGWGMDASRELPDGDVYLPIPTHNAGRLLMIDGLAMPLHPHNLILQVWLEIGGVGVVIMLAGMAVLLARLARAPRVGPAGLAMIAGILVVGASSFGAWQAWWLACQWLFAVYCVLLTGDEASLPMRSNSAAA